MRVLMLLAIVTLAAACRREDVPQSVRRPQRAVTTTSAAKPVDLAGKNIEFDAPLRPPVVDRCRTGTTLDANGLVSSMPQSFKPTDKIHQTVWLKESPPGLVMSIRALDADDKEVGVAGKELNQAKTVTLTLDALKAGTYRLETYWGGNVVCEERIEVK
jgi:hypothetical protein